MTIRCEIVSQDRTVFSDDVDIVVLPGAAGEMGILPKHAPVLTTLKYGVVKIRPQERQRGDLYGRGRCGGSPARYRDRSR